MIGQHIARGAGVTVAALAVPRMRAAGFGGGADRTRRPPHRDVLGKPAEPPGRPGYPDQALVSMGIYVFNAAVLMETLIEDAPDGGQPAQHRRRHHPPCWWASAPRMFMTSGTTRSLASAPMTGATGGTWGRGDSYFDARMDLCAVQPVFSLHKSRWPILTHVPPQPPAKLVHDGDRVGRAVNSLVSNGVIVSSGLVCNSVRLDKQRDRARGLAVSSSGIAPYGRRKRYLARTGNDRMLAGTVAASRRE